jgi:hypothetical protein
MSRSTYLYLYKIFLKPVVYKVVKYENGLTELKKHRGARNQTFYDLG